MSKLKNEEIVHQLKDLDDWEYTDNSLTRSYQLESFMDVMSFANLVSDKSEEIDHHPKMIIDYNNITAEQLIFQQSSKCSTLYS